MIEKAKFQNISSVFIISFCVIVIFCLSSVNGQDLPVSFLAKLKAEDNPNWRVVWDKETGLAKRLFGSRSKVFQGKPEDAAREFLSLYHGLFGLSPDLKNLQITESVKTPFGERVTLRQYYN